jgi:hemoglobin-like flavoprotein
MLEPEQKTAIRRTFAQIEPITLVAAALFYSRLFELAPQTEALFRYPLGTAGMARQGTKLIEMLRLAVGYLDRPEQLFPLLSELARRHVAYGVEPAHYDVVGAALLWTLQQSLGNAFTAEVEAAWAALYRDMAATMRRAVEGGSASTETNPANLDKPQTS